MLSLANTISSSSNAYEQLYSLDLDGVNDWLDIGDNWDPHQNDFSISLWFKADSDSGTADILFSKFVDNNNKIEIGINGSNKLFAQAVASEKNAINNTAGTELDALGLNWIHVVLTMDRDGNGKLYVNGSTSTYGLIASCQNDTQNLNNTGSIYIGARSDNNLDFPGKIDEVAIWATSLSETSVTAIYNSGKPFDLNYDRGNYTNSSNLHGYWRMGNGPFDDKQNGAVHDAHNPGFGSEALVNGNFATSGTPTASSNSLGWKQGNADDDGSDITGGELILTHTADSDGNYTRVYATNGSAFLGPVNGATYKFTYTVSAVPTGSPTLSYYDGDSYNGMEETIGTHTTYFVHDSTAGSNRFIIKSSGTSTEIRLSYVSLVRLNGYPGLTSGDAVFSADTPDD